jgi:hypothetical protein
MSMERFRRRSDSIERRLRRERPEPSDELIRRIAADVSRRPVRRGRSLGLAVALSCALVAAFALTGGIGYAGAAVGHGTTAVTHLVTGKSLGHSSTAKSGKDNGHHASQQVKGGTSSSSNNQYGHKVLICHHPPGNPGNAHTISVDQSAVPAHLAHGDTLGPCP